MAADLVGCWVAVIVTTGASPGQAAIYPLLLTRQRAEHELITLHRERAIQRAERDPNAMLNWGWKIRQARKKEPP
jgi:hypothetical protein